MLRLFFVSISDVIFLCLVSTGNIHKKAGKQEEPELLPFSLSTKVI
ncbi:hypothetical protein [Ammoniphilus sp. CFH 90114]|nr:hypothetical protein [Ammoniphilus sp. CFH 90114]